MTFGLTWLTGQSNGGKESRNASTSRCASITLTYLYTHTPGLSPCLWVSLVGVRGGWEMLGSNFTHTIMSLPETKKPKTNDTTQPKYLMAISTNGQTRISQPVKCVNCSGDHPSSSKQCPKYQQEQEIIKLK